MSVINFWKFLAISISNIFLFYSLSSPSCIPIMACYTFLKLLHNPWMFCSVICIFFFFLLDVLVQEDSIVPSSSSLILPLLCQVYSWDHQRHFPFALQWIWYLAFPFDLFSWSFHVSANVAHLFFHLCTFYFSIKSLNILIIVILYSLSDNFNICIIYEPGSVDSLYFFTLYFVLCCLLTGLTIFD